MEQNRNAQGTSQNEAGPEKTTSPEQGRQAGSAQPDAAEETSDISQIDQQEGQMNNGELGGNFNEMKDDAGGE